MKAVTEALEKLKCSSEGLQAPKTVEVLEAMAAELAKKPAPVTKAKK